MRDDIQINDRAMSLAPQLIEVFETIIDPEIELDMYNLGLIYSLHLDEAGLMQVVMTFTDVNCTCSETMPEEIIQKLSQLPDIKQVKVEITYQPVWKMTRISRYGRIALGIAPGRGK